MKKENTASRLAQIMSERNLRQIDILNRTLPYCQQFGVKMNKSDISQYCSGKTEPNQDKLFILGKALDVSEAWLMGYDVPMERNNYEDQKLVRFDAEFDAAVNILINDGYSVSPAFSDEGDSDIIIKNSSNEIVACMPDYELVNKYESLQKKGRISGKLLAETDIDLLEKRNAKLKAYAEKWNLHFFEKKMLDSFTQLSDSNKKKSISYTENLLSNQKMEEELLANAAHDRTDTEFTEEDRNADEDMLD